MAISTKLRVLYIVCGAIFEAAGERKLNAACNKLRLAAQRKNEKPCPAGEAVITEGEYGI